MADPINILSVESRYEDGSGPRTKIRFDSSYRLRDPNEQFVRIDGVGGDVLIHLKDIDMVIEALQRIKEIA